MRLMDRAQLILAFVLAPTQLAYLTFRYSSFPVHIILLFLAPDLLW